MVYTPAGNARINALQDEDKLTGTGTNATLTAEVGNIDGLNAGAQTTTITPKLTNVSTVNVNFTGSGAAAVNTLDLQDSTGVNTFNINRITDVNNNVVVKNFAAVPADLSVNNTNSPAAIVTFNTLAAAAAGTADAEAMLLNNVNLLALNLNSGLAIGATGNGIENVTMTSSGSANTLTAFSDTDISNLTINGAQALTIGTIGFNNTGKFTTIDGSTATGNLNLTIDAALNAATKAVPFGMSNGDVLFNIKTGSGNDTINGTDAMLGSSNDVFDMGAGTDTVALSNAATTIFTNSAAGAVTGQFNNVEAVTMTRNGTSAAATNLTVDMSKFTGDQTISLVDKDTIAGGLTTFTLNKLSAVEAGQITIVHSGATAQSAVNDGLANNLVVANMATDTASDTVGLTIATGTNADPRFNTQLTAAAVENVTLTDSDAEDNTVQLNSFAAETGTITVKGGTAGNFMNLDATANAYGKVTTGATGDATTVGAATLTYLGAATTSVRDTAVSSVLNASAGGELLVATKIDSSTYAGDMIARVGVANQNITMGTGNDTIVFADRAGITATTAGLTINDTVSGGTGTDTIVLDGTGAQTLGASEWTNLTGIDALRLAGNAGSTFNVTVTNQLVTQSDNKTNFAITNNDGLLSNAAENTATIDLRALDASHFVTFTGANGDGVAAQAGRAVQTIIVNDVNANGSNVLNGGDKDSIDTYALNSTKATTGVLYTTQAAADAAYTAAVAAGTDGNNNVLNVFNTAQVTIGDLANVSNFSKIQFNNDQAVAQTLNLTLDNATVDRMVDASHAANSTATETLMVNALDSTTVTGAVDNMTINAGTLSSSFGVNVLAGRGSNNITTGAGADSVTLLGNYTTGTYPVANVNGAAINTYANGTAGARAVNDVIDLGAGANTLTTYGAIKLVDATLLSTGGTLAMVANSAVVMTAAQFAAVVNVSASVSAALPVIVVPVKLAVVIVNVSLMPLVPL